MKSLFTGLLIGAMVALLAACGSVDDEPQAKPTPQRVQKPFPVDPAIETPEGEDAKG